MSEVATGSGPDDTFPKILLRNAKVRGGRTAYREKDLGIWQSWTWAAAADEIRRLACGLAKLGLKRGDRIAIAGSNRPQMYWSFDAIQAIGAVPVPVYADAVAEETRFVLDHAEVRCVICEDQEQIDKVLSIMDRLPTIEILIYEDERGLRNYTESFLYAFDKVQEDGAQFDRENPDFFAGEVAKSKGGDLAIIAYTSGTTGNPKGVMLSFDNLVNTARLALEMEGLTEREEVLAYLPPAWIGDYW